jgi:hypothetical protein
MMSEGHYQLTILKGIVITVVVLNYEDNPFINNKVITNYSFNQAKFKIN